MPQFLIACDKFKGSLEADKVCEVIKKTILEKVPDAVCIKIPMADGGDGSLQILTDCIDLQKIPVSTFDALGRPIKTWYGVKNNEAFIELAMASGLAMLDKKEASPLYTSTFGTGELIRHAIAQGCSHIYLMVGGSATNDGGMGILAALDYKFYDSNQKLLDPIGKNLLNIHTIEEAANLPNFDLTILTDVENPLFGLNGAAHIYGPQKGASAEDVALLDQGLSHLNELSNQQYQIDLSKTKGMGAAGGVAALPSIFLNASIKSGVQFYIELLDLDHQVEIADIVISGEGKLDEQSFYNKVVGGIYTLCKKYGKPLYVICGAVEVREGFSLPAYVFAFPLATKETDVENAINKPIPLIEERVGELLNNASFLE